MNTQKIDENNPPITSFTDSSDERETVGAGQISAQASEMLMLMSTSLPDDQSEKLYDLLEKVSNSTQSRQILDKDWIQSSRAMRDSALKNIREEHGDDAIVEFSAWDSPADFEDGLGINNHKKDKGFSTDTAFRVKKSDGKSVLSEVSNKKSLDVHLANPGANKTEDKILTCLKQIDQTNIEIKNYNSSLKKIKMTCRFASFLEVYYVCNNKYFRKTV